jgi:hypothetical protein
MHGAIPPLPQYAFMAWCSFKTKKHRDYTFYLTIEKENYEQEFDSAVM